MEQETSLKKNLIYNSMRIIIKMLFPILILPIVARKLGAETFGLTEYATSIASYFILLSSLGIYNYGSREVSILRNLKNSLSKLILELYYLLLLASIVSLIMYLLLIFAIPEFMNEWKLYLILGIQVLFTITLSGEWIYEGMENQKYITYRTFFTSLLLVLAIFFFINSSADYLKYVFFLSVINIISSIFNFFYLKKHIKVKHIAFKELSVTKHLRFVLIIFAAQITAIIYTQSAITIIGIFDNMESVGYYSMATKFFRLSTVLWSAFSGSLIPKLTYLWTCKDSEKYEIYANNIYSLIVLVSVFIGLMVFSLSEPIIICFAGEAFNESILTLRILSFGIFGSALAYFFGIILLYSQKNERKFLYASIFVAILNTLLNLIAIKFANYNAVAFITVISEYICFLYLVIRFKCNYKGIKILSNNTIKCLMAGITAGYITLLSINYTSNAIMQIIVGFLVGTIAYSMLLMLLKHVYLKSILLQLHKQFIR